MLSPETLKLCLKQILVLFVAMLALDLALPGIGATITHVFFLEQIKELPEHAKFATEKRKLYLAQKTDYTNRLRLIEEAVRTAIEKPDYTQLTSLISLRTNYKADLKTLKDPIIVSPFYQNRSVFYFLVAHLSLGLAIILTRTQYLFPAKLKQLLPLTIVLYVLFMSTNWLRNFVFYNEGRTIFSFVNFDLSPLCFFIQELQALLLCLMIAYYWMHLFDIYKKGFQQTKKWDAGAFPAEEFSKSLSMAADASNFINELLVRWQTNSVLIVCTFLPWTLFYWVNSVTYTDSRYLVSAVIFHVYWLITWILASVPLVVAFQRWLNFKTGLLVAYASTMKEEASFEHANEVLGEMTPLSVWQISLGGVAALVPLFLPLAHSFLHLYA